VLGVTEPDLESEKQRVDRELIELLNELRVALPGVQVLFAFLLAVPFQQRFVQRPPFEHDVYYVTLCLAFVATALLIAPSALHRLNFRVADKRIIVFVSNWLIIAGLGVLALSMSGVMLLITHLLFGLTASIVATSMAGVIFALLWVALPLRERRQAGAGGRELDGAPTAPNHLH
jgi:hypothetical protein